MTLSGGFGLLYQHCYKLQKPWVLFYYQDIDLEVSTVVQVSLLVQSCHQILF